jgi:hypothetical protein
MTNDARAQGSLPWFRFYSEALNDRKVKYICRTTGQPKVLVIGAWSTFMALANDSPIRGTLLLTEDRPFTVQDLADEMEIDEPEAGAIVAGFIEMHMLHQEGNVYCLTNWGKRQRISDSSAERVRRFRERQKEGVPADVTEPLQDDDSNKDVTLQARYGNAPDQIRSDTDTEVEQEGDTAPAPPPPKKRGGKQPKEPPPPAVARYRSIAELYPARALWPGIAQVVGERPEDLDRWGRTIMAYMACGWNKRNVKGMMEWFAKGELPNTRGGNGNGSHRQGNQHIKLADEDYISSGN